MPSVGERPTGTLKPREMWRQPSPGTRWHGEGESYKGRPGARGRQQQPTRADAWEEAAGRRVQGTRGVVTHDTRFRVRDTWSRGEPCGKWSNQRLLAVAGRRTDRTRSPGGAAVDRAVASSQQETRSPPPGSRAALSQCVHQMASCASGCAGAGPPRGGSQPSVRWNWGLVIPHPSPRSSGHRRLFMNGTAHGVSRS